MQRANRWANHATIRLLRAATAVFGAVALLAVTSAAPAAANPSAVATPSAPAPVQSGVAAATSFKGQLTVDCVVPGQDNTYRAVFGYDNYTGHDVTIPVGQANKLNPANLNGAQTIQFAVGPHRAAFATAAMPVSVDITWTVGGYSAKATSESAACGPEVSLPADGNGTAPLFVLAASLIALGVIALRLRTRDRARTRTA